MNPLTILIVDDNPANLKLIRLLLTQAGYLVCSANGAEEALQILSTSTPDVILTDIQLPGINGMQLTRLIRSNPRTKGLAILAISANAMKENIQEALDAGCDAYITKPIDTRTFISTIQQHLSTERNRCDTGHTTARDELAPLLESFLADCRQQIDQLLQPAPQFSWREDARDALHRCAGMAGTFGYPQITSVARDLETQSASISEDGLSSGLRRLHDLLTNAEETHQREKKPDAPETVR